MIHIINGLLCKIEIFMFLKYKYYFSVVYIWIYFICSVRIFSPESISYPHQLLQLNVQLILITIKCHLQPEGKGKIQNDLSQWDLKTQNEEPTNEQRSLTWRIAHRTEFVWYGSDLDGANLIFQGLDLLLRWQCPKCHLTFM